jgi:hypothetical protein
MQNGRKDVIKKKTKKIAPKPKDGKGTDKNEILKRVVCIVEEIRTKSTRRFSYLEYYENGKMLIALEIESIQKICPSVSNPIRMSKDKFEKEMLPLLEQMVKKMKQ